MNERELRRLIGDVKDGRLSRRGFVQRMVAVGLTAPMATQMLAYSGVAMAQAKPHLQADQARRRRPAQGAVVAGRRPCSIRISRSAPRTRTARASSTSRWPAGTPTATSSPMLAAEIPGRENGSARRRRQVGDLEAEAGRELARRQAVHRRRRRLQLGIRHGSGDRRRSPSASYKDVKVEKVDELHRQGDVREADAVLGRRLRRHARHDHPQAPVRRLHRRQVARGADQPQAGRHRPLQVQGLQAGRHGAGRDQPELPHAEPALFRHASR